MKTYSFVILGLLMIAASAPLAQASEECAASAKAEVAARAATDLKSETNLTVVSPEMDNDTDGRVSTYLLDVVKISQAANGYQAKLMARYTVMVDEACHVIGGPRRDY